MEFRLLGSLEACDDGRLLELGAAKQRAVLAVLLLNANRVVSRERLIEDVWGDAAPETAAKSIQIYISRLRKILSRERIQTRSSGYALVLEPDELDLERFQVLAEAGRQTLAGGDAPLGSARLREALDLWRGPALADFQYEPFAQGEIVRLEELRVAAIEDRLEADLAIGRAPELVGELEALVRVHPLRERLRGQLMLALYRSGRQADALAAYQVARTALVDELGIEPGESLRELETLILRQDSTLELRAPPRAAGQAPRSTTSMRIASEEEHSEPSEMRKMVTVVFGDVVDSTALGERIDPESLSGVMTRYFEEMRAVLERHGGTVEKFIGDAVMAVFGVPFTREDDALRAVRAASEMNERLVSLNGELESTWGVTLTARAGVNTGVVIVPIAGGPSIVVGAVVNVAARLEQEAGPGEILLGNDTYRLVRDAVRAEPAGPLLLKGRAEPVAAWRLVEVLEGVPQFSRHLDAPLVGRERELGLARLALAGALETRSAHLLTVFGPAGIGKSRLANELVASVGDEATALVGRCLSYGEGITFWPVAEMVRQAVGDGSLELLLAGEEQAELVAAGVARALGVAEHAVDAEETFWAIRRLFETLARRRALVCVFEDVHWAEPSLLDLIDHLAEWTRDAPLLLLCLARPELLEERPGWGGGKVNAGSILLGPLSEAESDALVANLLGTVGVSTEALGRIKSTAEGNPLYLEQLLAMLAEQGRLDEAVPLPPTIETLLAARLERLGPGERAVLERAAVVGKEFWQGAVIDLLPAEARPRVARHLRALVGKELVRGERSGLPGEEAFRFRHVLIQSTAYRAMPKGLRAQLHERFAAWLEGRINPGEYEEFLGYHLERAFRYRAELGPIDEHGRALGRRASARLEAAGKAAFRRGDMPGAAGLLERAVALLPEDDAAQFALVPDLSYALTQSGSLDSADAVLARTIERARAAGVRGVEWYAAIDRSYWQLYADPGARPPEEVVLEAASAIEVFDEAGDPRGLARAWILLADARYMRGEVAESVEAAWRVLDLAQRVDSAPDEDNGIEDIAWGIAVGPMPAGEGIGQIELLLERQIGGRGTQVYPLSALALLEAMSDRFAAAGERLAEADGLIRELGLTWSYGVWALVAGGIERLAGRTAQAEGLLALAFERFQEMGDVWFLSTAAVDLARAVYEQGRHEEAFLLTERFDETAAPFDREWQIKSLGVRALALASRQRVDEAEALAGEAVSIAGETDFLVLHGDALLDLAEVLRLAGRESEAVGLAEEAGSFYARKGDVVSARRAAETGSRLAAA